MNTSDGPNVIVFPPVIIIATLALAAGLQWLAPLGLVVQIDPAWRLVIGGLALVAGALPTIAGAVTLRHHGTPVLPSRPAVTLITSGIYGWTRNPMYAGGAPAMIGLALVLALDWLPLLMIPSFLVLHVGVVRREEAYLARKFGDAYRCYRARVPRYAGWPGATHSQTLNPPTATSST